MSARPLLVVKTGDPVAPVMAARGDFAKVILDAIGASWTGPTRIVDVRDGAPPDPSTFAAIVISGSPANVPQREPWMLSTEAWLRDVVAAGVPTFGICFGHQLLAQALGGEVRKNPLGREIGTVRVERLADDPLFDGVPASFEANATHVDTVMELPPGATVLARSRLDRHQALRFAERCYGVQFHPEIDAGIMRMYVDARRAMIVEEGLDASAIEASITDALTAKQLLQNFFRHVAP